MHHTLFIESRTPGVLFVNGFFSGPLEGEGQAFPVGRHAEIHIQFFPLGRALPLTAALCIRGGRIERLDPQDTVFALLWPGGIIQLELALGEGEGPAAQGQAAGGLLMAYLSRKLAGEMQADAALLRPQDAPDLTGYEAAVPLRFAPGDVPGRYDERAGLVRRIAPNAAVVDAALGMSVPAGQGRRMLERVDIVRT